MFLNIVTTSRRVINFFIFSKFQKKEKKCKKEKVIFVGKKIFIIIIIKIHRNAS